VDKPAGLSSHDAVQRVRRALRTKQAGHTGTLDPFATGLLVVLVGRATRLARFVEPQPKTYLATARLGLRTDTDDLPGAVVEEREVGSLSRAAVLEALAGFAGEQRQRPPAYSAKHVGGERSYRLACRGAAVEPPETTITVHRIEPIAWEPPLLTFRATVSAGTYLRAIARDLGARLGVGAHLTALRREAIGALRVEDAVPLDGVTPDALLPPVRVVGHLPAVELDEGARAAVVHGRAVADAGPAGSAGPGTGPVALLAGTELVAVARPEEGWLRPTVVLASP
jgi:tRNA pseudouridine55 synthase